MGDIVTKQQVDPSLAREILWRRGDLSWLLDENQEVLVRTYKESDQKIIVWNCARGLGKSFALCIVALENCLKIPNCLVKYACPKQKDATQIIQPLIRDIIKTCPDDLKPKFIKSDGAYKFKNGSQIQLSGLDNGRAESLRGGSAHLGIIDEAGSKSLKDLKYIVRSILMPAVTRTKEINGKIVMASTPPVSTAHPYVFYFRRAELNKSAITRTVYNNPRFTADMLKTAIEESGGIESTDFRREYLCEFILSEDDAIIPEFSKMAPLMVREWPRPPCYDGYIAMDIGMKDLTVVLFGYYDFKERKLVIEDEFALNGQTLNTKVLAENIKLKEKQNFTDLNTGEFHKPYKKISDNNLFVIKDLYDLHQLSFQATDKDDNDAAINKLRVMIGAGEIVINPRCVVLIRHLKEGTWAKNRKTFSRSEDNGHYDAIDSLKYLVRNLDKNHNPYPYLFGVIKTDGYFDMGTGGPSSTYTNLVQKMMNFGNKKSAQFEERGPHINPKKPKF